MKNRDLITFLTYQVQDKEKKITDNNMENVNLRMEVQHLKLAAKRLGDALEKEGDKNGN